MRKKEPKLPPPHAVECRDHRHAGTFEVLVPVLGRNKPHKVPLTFETLQAAENWIHSPEGKETIAEIMEESRKSD